MKVMTTDASFSRPAQAAANFDLTEEFVRGGVIQECVAGHYKINPLEVVRLSTAFGAESIVRRNCSCGTIIAAGTVRPEVKEYRRNFIKAAQKYDVPVSFGEKYDLSLISLIEGMIRRE